MVDFGPGRPVRGPYSKLAIIFDGLRRALNNWTLWTPRSYALLLLPASPLLRSYVALRNCHCACVNLPECNSKVAQRRHTTAHFLITTTMILRSEFISHFTDDRKTTSNTPSRARTFSFRKLFLKLFSNSGHSFLEGAAGKSLHCVVEVR